MLRWLEDKKKWLISEGASDGLANFIMAISVLDAFLVIALIFDKFFRYQK